jgi:hypothetical protein
MTRSTPPMRSRPPARVIAVWASVALLLALGLGACQALSAISYLGLDQQIPQDVPSGFADASGFPDGSGVPDASDPCTSAPPSFVAFSHGSATLNLVTGSSTQHLVLDRVDGAYAPGDALCGPGTGAVFSTLDGVWSLEVDGSPDLISSGTADVLVAYDNQGTSFYAGTSGRCRTSVTTAGATGIVGTATCTDAFWIGDNDQTPAPSASFGGTFSATITFEARP